MPLYNFGSGGGDNFANADLTFTGNRIHDLGNNQLLIDGETNGGTTTSFRVNTNGGILPYKSFFQIDDQGLVEIRGTDGSGTKGALRIYDANGGDVTFHIKSRGDGFWLQRSGNPITIGQYNASRVVHRNNYHSFETSGGVETHRLRTQGGSTTSFLMGTGFGSGTLTIGATAPVGTEKISLQGTTYIGDQLTVQGTGSTSATTTALFENSSGTDLLDIKDDGTGIINATGRVIRLFKSTAFNPYIELNSSVGDNCSFVFSQGASSKYSIGFENFTGDFRIFDIAAGVNRLSVTSTGKINLFAPSTTTENFNVKGTGLFEINDNNPLTVRTTNNANMFLAIDSASTSWNSQVQFQQGTAAQWNIGCKGTTQSFWFFNHATTNTPLEIDSSDNIIMANLPTSSAGLPTGALWNNSGVINIV